MSEITLAALNLAIAGAVKEALPEVTVYDNPNQQGSDLPCVVINYRNSSAVDKQIGNRFLRTVKYDLVYLEEYNLPDLNDRFLRAADALDERMELFSFPGANPIRTLNRNWFVELAALHYQFDVKARVSLPDEGVPMEEMRLFEEVTDG